MTMALMWIWLKVKSLFYFHIKLEWSLSSQHLVNIVKTFNVICLLVATWDIKNIQAISIYKADFSVEHCTYF
jgi:hypothetical protein